MTLTEFLLARIAEDEAQAPLVPAVVAWRPAFDSDAEWTEAREWAGVPAGQSVEVRTRESHPDPRVLAECEAKRRIVEREDADGIDSDDFYRGLWWAMRALAVPYADHPDYNEAWRP